MLNLLNIFKNGLTLCLMLIIVGCASDGIKSGSYVSDGDTNSQYSNFTLYDPTSIRSFKIQTIGAKSANTYSTSVAGYGKAIVSLSRSDFVEDNNNCTSDGCRPVIDICSLNIITSITNCEDPTVEPYETIEYQMYSNKHITDTDAELAWASGWTGLGQTISVIDDFSNVEVDLRIGTNSSYYLRERKTHGDVVANIAGGDGQAAWTSENITYLLSGHYGKTASTSLRKSAGVAKDATIVTNHVDLSSTQNVENTLNGIIAHLENSNAMAAVNLSIGYNINTVGITYDELMADAENAKPILSTDAVITVAAGNGGAACTSQNLNGCNGLGIALAVNPNTNKNTILVGATTGTEESETIATYSSRGGMFSSRFLLASGDTGLNSWDGDPVTGTSFAAPRVAGAAAILRQKFPNLSGSDAASILLLTASKDINNDGINEFEGVSATFGHGKLNLTAALSPVGNLVLK